MPLELDVNLGHDVAIQEHYIQSYWPILLDEWEPVTTIFIRPPGYSSHMVVEFRADYPPTYPETQLRIRSPLTGWTALLNLNHPEPVSWFMDASDHSLEVEAFCPIGGTQTPSGSIRFTGMAERYFNPPVVMTRPETKERTRYTILSWEDD